MRSTFRFVGKPSLPKNSKRPFMKEGTFKDKNKKTRKYVQMNFGVKCGENNMGFVEGFDSEKDEVNYWDYDGEKTTIDWEDRFDEDILDDLPRGIGYTINLGEDFGGRRTFLTLYDAMYFLEENLPNYKGKIMVTGDFERTYYPKNGNWYDKFKFKNVFAIDEENEVKDKLEVFADIYYNKNCIDKTDWKEEKKIYLDGFIEQYISSEKETMFVPMRFAFSGEKYKVDENELHKKLLKYKLSYIDIKNKNYVHIPWEIRLIRGAEEVDFDETMLTEKQKEQVELGIKTLDDFKPRGAVFGNNINEYRLFDPYLKGDFEDGILEADETNEEFEEKIYQPVMEESEKDMNKGKVVDIKELMDDDNDETEDIDLDVDDLF